MWTNKTTPYFALGTSVHAGLQRWYHPVMGAKKDGDIGVTIDYYRKTWSEESAKVDWSAEATRDILSEAFNGEQMLKEAILIGDDWEAKSVEETLYSEVKHSRLGTLPVRLKTQLDMITVGNDVVEHKTAERKWEKDREHRDIQATAYANAIRDNFGHDPSVTFNIISKNAKGPVVDRRVTHRNSDDIDRLYVGARAMLDAVEKGAIYPNPTAFAHATCEFKPVCNKWESHPQQLPESRKAIYNLIPTLKPGLWPDMED